MFFVIHRQTPKRHQGEPLSRQPLVHYCHAFEYGGSAAKKQEESTIFKIVKALDKKCSDHTSKLAESRLEIAAERGRVV
jgi:hypothetical protein